MRLASLGVLSVYQMLRGQQLLPYGNFGLETRNEKPRMKKRESKSEQAGLQNEKKELSESGRVGDRPLANICQTHIFSDLFWAHGEEGSNPI